MFSHTNNKETKKEINNYTYNTAQKNKTLGNKLDQGSKRKKPETKNEFRDKENRLMVHRGGVRGAK